MKIRQPNTSCTIERAAAFDCVTFVFQKLSKWTYGSLYAAVVRLVSQLRLHEVTMHPDFPGHILLLYWKFCWCNFWGFSRCQLLVLTEELYIKLPHVHTRSIDHVYCPWAVYWSESAYCIDLLYKSCSLQGFYSRSHTFNVCIHTLDMPRIFEKKLNELYSSHVSGKSWLLQKVWQCWNLESCRLTWRNMTTLSMCTSEVTV